MAEEKLISLIRKYISGNATAAEMYELKLYLGDDANADSISVALERILSTTEPTEYDSVRFDPLLKNILEADKPVIKKTKIITMPFRWAAAAAVLIIFSVGSYFYFNKEVLQQAEPPNTIAKTNDVAAPASNKATITLANGKRILLDSAGNGILAKEGNVSVTKLADGHIVYGRPLSGLGFDEIQYNTLTNPRGSKVVNVTLHDGTKVWINAESSLKFPVAFFGKDRKVEITGEAYFEVAHNASNKFLVEANGVTTEVLGTHFNVNAYDDENDVRVTLLEGSVKINKSVIIKPGQQAQVTSGIKVVNADVKQVTAWKNGLFDFKNADIKEIMSQAARWYDIEVVFSGTISPEKYKGMISRSTNLSEMMKILSINGVTYKIEGKKITIMN